MKLLFIFIFITSCSGLKIIGLKGDNLNEVELNGYVEFEKQDYIDHLISFETFYNDYQRKNKIRLRRGTKNYLQGVVRKIISANELFFEKKGEANFTIIKAAEPFHFSLPGRRFYLSSGLLRKYIKNEDMLYCVIVYELIRSEKNLYTKNIIIPTGSLDTNRILSILRLPSVDKVEIHKWSYYLLKRTGVGPDSYLSWLQVKNRNSLDFSLQLGDIRSISREEALFKAFLIEAEKDSTRFSKYRGSSKAFYRLLNEIKA